LKEKNTKKTLLGAFTLVISFILLVFVVSIFYDIFTSLAGSRIAQYFPEDTIAYVHIPESILESDVEAQSAFFSFIADDLEPYHQMFERYGISFDTIAGASTEMHIGFFESEGETQFLTALRIDPAQANVLLSAFQDDYLAESDGERGSLVQEKGDGAFEFLFKDGYLFVSSDARTIDVVQTGDEERSLIENERFTSLVQQKDDASGLFFVKTQEVYDLAKRSDVINADEIALPLLSDGVEIAGFFDYFNEGVRLRILSQNESSQQSEYNYEMLLQALPASASFISFGSLSENPADSMVETGVDLSRQYAVILDEIEDKYGLNSSDSFFNEVFDHFVFFALPFEGKQTYGIAYEVDGVDVERHTELLEERITDIVALETVEEKEFTLSDGTVATEFMPRQQEIQFSPVLRTGFTAPVTLNEDGSIGDVIEGPSYSYADGVMKVALSSDAAYELVKAETEGSSILEQRQMSYFNAQPDAFQAGVLAHIQTFIPLSEKSFSHVAAFEQDGFVDVLLYLNNEN
jgi:hypothetical protein